MDLNNLSLLLPHKSCFSEFEAKIRAESRIAIIGRNGSGKSTLLKMIRDKLGDVVGYIPQIIMDFENMSGGERFNRTLSEELGKRPNILLLDEPTNHLDTQNRKSLIRMLKKFHGTVIVVTHDLNVLRNCCDTIWHIEDGKINVFNGSYDDYILWNQQQKQSIQDQKDLIKYQKKEFQEKLQKQQEKLAKSKAQGKKKLENKRWMKSIADLKTMKAEKAGGKKLSNLNALERELQEQESNIFIPKFITPKFNIAGKVCHGISIRDGTVGYCGKIVLKNINISTAENFAIVGSNGSGKTTLIKGIMNDPLIERTGQWDVPSEIGYIDQHYSVLNRDLTVFQVIKEVAQDWTEREVRSHLNDFLFRKNEEVEEKVENLSGGEMARLCMAKVAANPPALLIMDEITNNIDLETKGHISNILKDYKWQFIIISHDEEFLDEINVENKIDIETYRL